MLPTDDTRVEVDTASLEKSEAIRLLIVEDSDEDAFLLNTRLQHEYPGVFQTQVVRTVKSAVEILSEVAFDAVILDQNLPDGLGVMSISAMRETADRVPIIMLTGVDDDMLEFEAIVRGAQDYLPKREATGPAVRRAVLHAIERERLQKELDKARDEALIAQQQVFSHISHELRSPVAAMYHSATNQADGLLGKTTPAQEEAAQIIVSGSKSLRRLVDDLLDTTRIAEGTLVVEPERVRLQPLVREVLDGMRSRWNDGLVSVEGIMGRDLPAVFADPVRLRQVISNVFQNALVHAPGAKVAVEAHWDPTTAGHVLLSIRDDGPGIPPYLLERIFERMYQADDDAVSGLGLGLYISRDLIERMGGRIWAEKNGHKGAIFHIRLPVHPLDEVLMPVLGRRSQPDVASIVSIRYPEGSGSAAIEAAAKTISTTFPDSVVLDSGEIVGKETIVAMVLMERRGADDFAGVIGRLLGFGRSEKHQPALTVSTVKIPPPKRRALNERIDRVIRGVLAELPEPLANHLGAEVT
jgi:signal transduction histidine kinase